jgi:hypothetical protein
MDMMPAGGSSRFLLVAETRFEQTAKGVALRVRLIIQHVIDAWIWAVAVVAIAEQVIPILAAT